mgnify:CR=1 FL=1
MNVDKVVEEVKARLADVLLEAKVERKNYAHIKVKPEGLVRAAQLLKECGYSHPASVTGVDYPDRGEIEVIYHVESIEDKAIVALRTAVSRDNPSLPTLRDVWMGVHYHERETWEMLGVKFEGHPELKRFLLQEDWEEGVYPLRKEFKLKPES